MADNSTPVADPTATPPASASPASQASPKQEENQSIPYARFKEEIDKHREATAELERLRAEDKKRKDDEAIAKGEFTKVIDELKPKAERMEALEKSLNAVIEAEMKAIPEDRRTLVPDLPPEKKLEYIATNRAFLMDNKPANVNRPLNPDGSHNGGSQQSFTLAQIQDPKFYEENRDAILKAQVDGRIRD